MIAVHCFTKDWIALQARRTGTQEVVLEKSLLALALVGRLAEAGLDFIFKGGSSLMLHLEPVRRLSIDVDIASLEPLDRVQQVLNEICDGRPFTRWSHQSGRDGENPPTKYFRLFYRSPLSLDDQDSHVQLDVLVTEAVYPEVVEKEVRADFLELERPVRVRVPSVDCLLGDKLAAFAPTTIGILYEPVLKKTGEPAEPRPIRVMKQLFDVGELFAEATNPVMVAESYRRHFEEQNRWRGSKFTVEETLNDSIVAAYHLSEIDLKPQVATVESGFFRSGVTALNSHLLGRKLPLYEAKTAAARAALLAVMLKTGRLDTPLRTLAKLPDDPNLLKSLRIDGPWRKLHTLRKTNIEAFYLWHLAASIHAGSI